ncbi:MAG: ABC transporter ATP-binding protein [Clostridia bacterium]|nr:ABC transporter ATP-binding protein [Clostridia bacterium]
MEIIKVENLTKKYGKGENEILAVNNASFTVQEGEFIAVIGASGSGKSTLLHLIAGLEKPTDGKVYFYNKNIYEMNKKELTILRRQKIGIIYQFYNLIPTLNVEENITLPIELDKKKVDRKKLEEIMKFLNMDKRKNHLPNELSGGQQQKVAIGRALMIDPTIILADEPTGNLDSKSSEEIIKVLKESNKKYNQTIIMITHNLEIAKEADRIIKIEDGKIVEDRK